MRIIKQEAEKRGVKVVPKYDHLQSANQKDVHKHLMKSFCDFMDQTKYDYYEGACGVEGPSTLADAVVFGSPSLGLPFCFVEALSLIGNEWDSRRTIQKKKQLQAMGQHLIFLFPLPRMIPTIFHHNKQTYEFVIQECLLTIEKSECITTTYLRKDVRWLWVSNQGEIVDKHDACLDKVRK
jgi:hypothetical protein